MLSLLVLVLLAGTPLEAQPVDGFVVESMVEGLEEPVAFAFAPDGRIFVNERRRGQIRVVRDGQLLETPFATVPVCSSGERGLLGLALEPEFTENPAIYVLHTHAPGRQRIVRFSASGDVGEEPTVILDGIPAGVIHNGGSLGFGPDGKLYYTVGDTGDRTASRDVTRIPGKIHRINRDGSLPDDNPWASRSAFCLGCRNSFDFTFHPDLDPVVIFATENGPTVDDEINRVVAGEDYGWPVVTGTAGDKRFRDPMESWRPTTAPVGIAYYEDGPYPANYLQSLFVAEYTTGFIRHLELSRDGTQVLVSKIFLEGGHGPLLDLAVGPDGCLWFSSTRGLFRIRSTRPAPTRFIRGDVDGSGRVDPLDAVQLIAFLGSPGSELPCRAAADVDADEVVDFADLTTLLGFLFGEIPDLPGPFPDCGRHRSGSLDCSVHRACR